MRLQLTAAVESAVFSLKLDPLSVEQLSGQKAVMSRHSPELLRIVRIDELLQNLADSEQIACMVIDEFLVHYEPQLLELSRALEQGDLSLLAQAAHRLKGSMSAVSAAWATTERAAAMEQAALHGDLNAVRSELAALGPRVATLAEALRAWRAERAP